MNGSDKRAPLTDEEQKAFQELYQTHHRRVYSTCLRMTRDASEAEDLTHEIFVHLFRALGSFRGESAFTTWLHRLTVNHVLINVISAFEPKAFLPRSLPLVSQLSRARVIKDRVPYRQTVRRYCLNLLAAASLELTFSVRL